MARMAELTYGNKSGPIPRASSLLTSDVSPTQPDQRGGVMTLSLRNAKTCAPGETQEIQLRKLGMKLCPLEAVGRRLANAKGVTTSLFGFQANGKRQHLTRNVVVTTIKKVWTNNNLEGLSGHSFRVGGASLRAAMGVPVEEICSLGRWTSNCYKLYLRPYSLAEVAESKALLRRLTDGSR
ncbi:hypothetical protein PGTUg99_007448 [Puccinia graminis f. sp. tritici]|uniref:Tyr recombinase domain-containing protein n=1 Tax=Puccinia graminis f. sp. tritici TaxID=56615 RepID=A0A5B0PCP2_PUCGR|nr:hypothetical protein PGTUg99_007448 [Puccinia graminis f. sp. tritici]